jgi:hypothetical protein
LSGSQPVYNGRGNVVFGTCDEIHKHDSTRELVSYRRAIAAISPRYCRVA